MARRLPPLNALRVFEAVASHLSFARAAGELHVTPAAVSQQIKQLEDHLGLALFRRGRSLTLTEPAAAALPLLREGFDGLERAVERLRAGRASGPLVVSVPPSYAARWLIPRLERFQARHPEIELHLSATTRVVDFATEEVDVAVRYGGGRYPGLFVERLTREEVIVVCAPALASGLREPADLAGATLLHDDNATWDPSFPDWTLWLRLAEAGGVDGGRGLRFGDVNLALEAAVAGLGVALVRRTLAARELEGGRLVQPFANSLALGHAHWFVCPPRRLELPRVAAFRAWLRAECGLED